MEVLVGALGVTVSMKVYTHRPRNYIINVSPSGGTGRNCVNEGIHTQAL